MKFTNTAPHALDFELGGKRFIVPSGDEGGQVDIPTKLAGPGGRFVTMRGLPLAPVEGSEEPQDVPDEPEADVRVWRQRALDAAADAKAFRADLVAVTKRAEEAEGELSGARMEMDQLREDLDAANALVHSASQPKEDVELTAAQAAIEQLKAELAEANALLHAATEPAAKVDEAAKAEAPADTKTA